jgi:AraC-like DNA-binding protein
VSYDAFYGLEGFLDARPPSGKIRAGYFKGLSAHVRRGGGNYRKILDDLDLAPVDFEDPDHAVDCLSAAGLVERCGEVLDDPLFGLRLAADQDPNVFGCVMSAARAAPDLRQALLCLAAYMPVSTSPECVLEVVCAGRVAELRWSTTIDVGPFTQADFHGFHLMMKTLRTLAGRSFSPLYANVVFSAPRRQSDTFDDIVGARVNLGSDANAIGFSTELLNAPLPSENKLVFKLLSAYLARVNRIPLASTAARAKMHIRAALPAGPCTVEGCAEKLGTSARTLQKRLAEEGASFSALVNEERLDLAKHALAETGQPVAEIALDLGYWDPSSFGRAFKRWTQLSPQAYRSRAQGG